MAETLTNYTLETFTASDGYRWRYRRYCDKKRSDPPRAHVVCLHGIQSHAGWYEYSCTRLSEGFQIYFLDRRGSGSNNEARGDTPSFGRLLDDVAEFLAYLRSMREQSGEGLPVFLAAISWGGKLAAALPRWRPGQVDGLALLCPGFFPKVRSSWRQRLRIGWSRLVAPQRLFSIPLNDPALFTSNPHWLHFLKEDSNSLHRATACFRKQGCEVVPCGCGYHPRLQWSASAFLPDLGAAAGSQEAFHEWLGITWYRLRGWL